MEEIHIPSKNLICEECSKPKPDPQKIKQLISKGGDINAKNENGKTPLHLLAINKNTPLELINLVLSTEGVDPNICDGHSNSALHLAAENGNEQIGIAIARTKNIDINISDAFGRKPLHWVAQKGLNDLAKQLISSPRIDINAKTLGGDTALLWASLNGHENIVRLLIDAKADPTIRNNKQENPLQVASTDQIANILGDAMIGLEDKEENVQKINQTSQIASSSQVKQLKTNNKKKGGKKLTISLQKKENK
eukprot:TRINITY_DN1916_c0_g1_i3.p1 TRINITY_DN1916_c0_g1~~TRINITY_DN1916_c0_g1_i3.p1  ORF type:complete len:251 (-),score=79.83 TRINITY_DN1916_c0_g1_i3:22-774(-)